ncbi:conserved Plasmodium protein, unknown function [Plasmodium gaboni]|uniref:Uncharacterized protein n=1 Tax=Plasmodium gaboni TaxID=647221 RepID=A0ABY1UWW7_9APIC|nr:conserved Plasmodium protein, unknown function [Plasmodium gaboni]
MSSNLYSIKELNKDTILLKTRKLKQLCESAENINSQHVNCLIEILNYFFEKYDDCFSSSVVWEVVDKIIILENRIEERKNINVDFDTSIKFCEYIFSKLILYTNYQNDNLTTFFSFNCLRRHLCSLISSFLNFNNSSMRKKIESSFTNELMSVTKKIFETIKIENDIELKVSYTEFLWRSFRRIDTSTFNLKNFRISLESVEKLRNFKIIKFDEECINWLKEEYYIDNKIVMENGTFVVNTNNKSVTKSYLLCYVGRCSIFLYYDNEEENEKCKIEIPYYHITSINIKNKNLLELECKAIVDQTNIFYLWGEDIKNSIDHEIISKFKLSLDIKRGSKEIKNLLTKLMDTLNIKLKNEKKKREQIILKSIKYNKKYNEDQNHRTVDQEEDKSFDKINETLNYFNDISLERNISEKNIKNKSRKRTEILKQEEEKKRKNICNEEIVKYNKSIEDINYINEYANKQDTKIYTEDDKFRMIKIKNQMCAEKDSDTEMIIEKIISCHKEKKEKFKINLKKSFSESLNEIDNMIKSLIEKQKIRREELNKKYTKKKKSIIFNTEKEINLLCKEMNILIESMRKINVNKSDVKKIYDEGKSIFSTNEILNKSQIFMKKIKDNLEKMNTDIIGKEKEYNKRKKLCFKALATAYE